MNDEKKQLYKVLHVSTSLSFARHLRRSGLCAARVPVTPDLVPSDPAKDDDGVSSMVLCQSCR